MVIGGINSRCVWMWAIVWRFSGLLTMWAVQHAHINTCWCLTWWSCCFVFAAGCTALYQRCFFIRASHWCFVSSSIDRLLNLDLRFACSDVPSVLWRVRLSPPCRLILESLVCPSLSVSLAHINTPQPLVSSSVVCPLLSPSPPSGGSLGFVLQSCASGLCCVKVLPTVFSLLGAPGYQFSASTHEAPSCFLSVFWSSLLYFSCSCSFFPVIHRQWRFIVQVCPSPCQNKVRMYRSNLNTQYQRAYCVCV